MAELLKQLKIKTSMLKRLRKEYESYAKQTKSITLKIEGMQAQQQTGDIQYDIKKHKQFLEQSQSVLSNVKSKLIESFEGLANFLSEKGDDQNIKDTTQKNQAEELVLQIETYLQSI